VALSALVGCGKKTDAKAGLSDLEKAFPAASIPAPQPQTEKPVAPQPAAIDANAYVNSALAAVRTNDYVKGVVALESAERGRGMTADQLMAIARAKQAIISDLINRAARGDANAQAQLAAIEKTRSQ
jgi:hypothetical protein